MVERKSLSYRIRMTLTYSIVIALGLICFIPVWNMICYSFSSAVAIQQRKVSIIPVDFNLDAYAKILSDEQFWVSFWISVKRVGLSLILNVVLIVLMAYPLSKSSIDFRGRNVYMYFLPIPSTLILDFPASKMLIKMFFCGLNYPLHGINILLWQPVLQLIHTPSKCLTCAIPS